MRFEILNPPELGEARGFNNGLLGPAGGRILFIAGQTGRDAEGRIVSDDFATQFAVALDHVLRVVHAAGGRPEDIGRMTIYVTDLAAYRASLRALGIAWRERLGRHYPAVALLEVNDLVDEGAVVEIEATAVLTEDTEEA